MDALETHVSIVLLEREVHCAVEANVRSFDGVHIVTGHLELVKVEVFGEHLHLETIKKYFNINKLQITPAKL